GSARTIAVRTMGTSTATGWAVIARLMVMFLLFLLFSAQLCSISFPRYCIVMLLLLTPQAVSCTAVLLSPCFPDFASQRPQEMSFVFAERISAALAAALPGLPFATRAAHPASGR